MSSDYYFRQWKKTLSSLETLVQYDIDFQETKIHDRRRCEASNRLSGILGQYIVVYNDAMDCFKHNLQLQKTAYLADIIKAMVLRILELKHELRKLDSSFYQFLSEGLSVNKLTTYDAEISSLPSKIERPKHVQDRVEEIFRKLKDKKIESTSIDKEDDKKPLRNWWEDDELDDELETNSGNINDNLKKVESEETIVRRRMTAIIQAHEKSRQVTCFITQKKNKREMWIKELNGTLKPQARIEIRERSAKLIQMVCRAYFEMKRKNKKQCIRDQILGISICDKQNVNQQKEDEIYLKRSALLNKYNYERTLFWEKIKRKYSKLKTNDINEDYRDLIRNWFQKWFNEVRYFYNIPKKKEGGSMLIIKEDVPSPAEWLEEYEKFLEEKKSRKGKSLQELKWAKLESKREATMHKREEQMKKKSEAELMRKLMKNPTLHPGFIYPRSNITPHILKAIEKYHRDWDDFDITETLNTKEKFIEELELDNICMETKINIIQRVDEDMREELKILKMALKVDFRNNNERMPKVMRKPIKKNKIKRRVQKTISEHIFEKIEDLALGGILKEYPRTNLEDFIGEYNLTAHDSRCNYLEAHAFAGEIRNVWWEKCRDIAHGFNKILIVGPIASGKQILIHALASLNDAFLFELDPTQIQGDLISAPYLQQLVISITNSAKAVQPSVIHIKHIQRLYYTKVPPEEANLNLNLLRKFLIRKLFKRINKSDNITIIATCLNPWVTKSNQLLKQFPTVVLMPDTSYATTVQILKDWLANNKSIPHNLDIQSLARVLQGYSFGFIKQSLNNFLSPERIIKIAVHGLAAVDIYDYILQDDKETKVNYEKYLKWYYQKTLWGKKEMKHLQEQKEFKLLLDEYLEKKKKKQKSEGNSATRL